MHLVFYLLAAVLIALNVADWRLTRAIVRSGRGYEANPVMAWLIDRFGLDVALGGKALLVAAFIIWLVVAIAPTAALLVALALLGLNGFYVWVVLNNIRVLYP